ncbi:MAG: F0F1 ATP synthase subunit epsilon [Muribaculaceae bacterium]|nr:F0F1 ATP synthase subunit epsilon [Muribaculaceae bacterium]
MILKIISAEDVLFQGEVESVTLPGAMGQFTVLHNHASLISTLVPGKIAYRTPDGHTASVDTDGGLVDVDNNVVSVCVY